MVQHSFRQGNKNYLSRRKKVPEKSANERANETEIAGGGEERERERKRGKEE